MLHMYIWWDDVSLLVYDDQVVRSSKARLGKRYNILAIQFMTSLGCIGSGIKIIKNTLKIEETFSDDLNILE